MSRPEIEAKARDLIGSVYSDRGADFVQAVMNVESLESAGELRPLLTEA
jgi:hypothetical protein